MSKLPNYLKIIRAVILMGFCFVLWLLLSMDFHYLSVIAGLFFAAAAVTYSYSIFYDKEVYYRSDFIIRFEFFILFAILFVIQSYLASFELIYRIITGNYQPSIVRIKTRLNSQMGRVFLANTISMIPGTLSLWIDGNRLYVHWFDTKTTHTVKAGYIIKQSIESLLEKIFG